MGRNLKALFFDFDGVLMDSMELILENIREFCPDYSDEDFLKFFHGNAFEDERISNIFKNHRDEFDLLFAEKTKAEHFFDFAERLIDDLSQKYKLYIVSGAPTYSLVSHLNLIDSTHKFTKIYGSDIAETKVERFNMLFESENLDSSECIFVTDSLGDIIEANEVKLRSVGVTYGVHSREILEKGNPYRIVDQISEFEALLEEL